MKWTSCWTVCSSDASRVGDAAASMASVGPGTPLFQSLSMRSFTALSTGSLSFSLISNTVLASSLPLLDELLPFLVSLTNSLASFFDDSRALASLPDDLFAFLEFLLRPITSFAISLSLPKAHVANARRSDGCQSGWADGAVRRSLLEANPWSADNCGPGPASARAAFRLGHALMHAIAPVTIWRRCARRAAERVGVKVFVAAALQIP